MANRCCVRIVLAGVAVTLSFFGWSRAEAPTTAPSSQPALASQPQVGDRAPNFTLTSVDGQSVSLANAIRHGAAAVVVLRGWPGYQCPVCTKQVADLRRRANDFAAAHARVILIYPGPAELLKRHASEFVGDQALPAGFTLVLDPDYAFTNAWHLRWDASGETAYPSSFVIDRTGIIRFAKISQSHGGRVTPDELLNAIKSWR